MAEESSTSLEYTPTWVVAVVCFVIVLISLCAERGLHRLGKCLKHKQQDKLFEALQKLKEELMLLGFISLLLTIFQGAISHICIPPHLATRMLPCEKATVSHDKISLGKINIQRQLLSTDNGAKHCAKKGKVPFLSLEALHHLHIFIFVLAVTHVIFCATTMLLGGVKIKQWKLWEEAVRDNPQLGKAPPKETPIIHQREFLSKRAIGYWKKAAVVSWLISFFKQFYGSVTKSDYIALRQGFIMAHCPRNTSFDFHNYMTKTLEMDFKKVVGISWYLWLFVVIFLLLDLAGWHTYFWLAFLPLVLLLLVGAKLEHIITRLAQDVELKRLQGPDAGRVKPSNEYFWFHSPVIVLNLIHFILFQNSFEIAFFFWILFTYGFHSCIMEKPGFIIPRLVIGVIVQVLCSYSTLPLYAIVTQMGEQLKHGIFVDRAQESLDVRVESAKNKGETSKKQGPIAAGNETETETETETGTGTHMINKLTQEMLPIRGSTTSVTEVSCLP